MRGEWVSPGAHVTSVGVNPHGRELDEELVAAAHVVVESRGAAFAPFPAGANELSGIGPDDVSEIGEVLGREAARPQRREQITLWKSVGVAVMDAAAVALVLRAAAETGRRHRGRTLKVEDSVEIAKPQELVYALVRDLDRAPEWQESLESVDVEAGTEVRRVAGFRQEAQFFVLEDDPPRRLVDLVRRRACQGAGDVRPRAAG